MLNPRRHTEGRDGWECDYNNGRHYGPLVESSGPPDFTLVDVVSSPNWCEYLNIKNRMHPYI